MQFDMIVHFKTNEKKLINFKVNKNQKQKMLSISNAKSDEWAQ